MKRIIDECSKGLDQVNKFEVIKLRLRGKGSGFKEGTKQEESQDPLNLCISSKYKDKYDFACSEMEKLLLKVYQEYKTFYMHRKNKPANWGEELTIKKEETSTRPKVVAEPESNETDGAINHIQAQFNQLLHMPQLMYPTY